MPAPNEPIEDYVDAAGRLLKLAIAPEWRAGVIEQLAIILRNADLVAEFPLPDDTDPAPTFEVTDHGG